ncbi:MAG: CotH kinase family protein, partial [Limisphaerales bacterium]
MSEAPPRPTVQRLSGFASPRRQCFAFLPGFRPHGSIRALVLVLFSALASCSYAALATPVISEFMAANQRSLSDENGEFSDWIELHNPGAERVYLLGWSLTDDPDLPRKWLFPERFIEPDGYLLVFASGTNRVGLTNLHANFRLDASGEYLGLFPPDAVSAVSEFRPAFPPQEPDVSFGVPAAGRTIDLLSGAPVSVLIPSKAEELSPDWAAPGFVPGPLWQRGAGLGVGFDAVPAAPGGDLNLALSGTAFQSSTGFGFGADFAIDGDSSTFTHTGSDDNASSWWVDLGKTVEVRRIVLRNRENCCGSRLRDLTVELLGADGQVVIWSSELLNPENLLGSPAAIVLDFLELNLGPIPARTVRVTRTPDPDLSGGDGNDDEDNVLSLGEVEVYGVETLSFGPLIRMDLGASMSGRSSSAFVRVPFILDDPDAVRSLRLYLRYDDGVIVQLNGTSVTSLNAPETASWDSSALGKRVKSAVFEPGELDLETHRSAWKPGTNWLALQGLNASITDPDFLVEARLVAVTDGVVRGAYFELATPGAANEGTWNLGQVADTTFSVKRGRRTAPFDLSIATDTPGAEVRYTLDGSVPGVSRGQVYTGPIRLERTTVVRAAAFKDNFRPTDVDTHTYVFLDDVVTQSSNPPGFPARWAGVNADYAMDPRITQAPEYAGRMAESLTAVPTLALTTETDDLFGATRGIYANPERNGVSWERPASMEWIDEEGAGRFQVDCGLRIQGGYFRDRNVTQKHSFRVLFKDVYGPGKLREDLFREFGAAREFDTLVLRAGANDGYAWDAARDTEQFLRDEFGRRSSLAMGQPSVRGRFVHLYLNGLYWGLYNLTERPAEDFSATYLGGVPEDWDAINSGEVKSGSLETWNAFLGAVRAVRTLADYQRLKGLNPEGDRNESFPEYLDAPNYLDYMLLNIWGGNWDWPNKNFWFGRHRGGLAGGFKFYLWDFENTMGNNRDRSPLTMVAPRAGITGSWVGEPHDRLRGFGEYRIEFADRVHRHFFGRGALTPSALTALYRELADLVEPAVIAETARWGDDHFSTPQDLTDWRRERDWILGTYLPQRTGIVLAQLRSAGLYPQTDAPGLSPPGGPVSPQSPVRLSTTASEVFYTTNGVDPRLPGGAVHPEAIRVAFTGGGGPPPDPGLIRSGRTWRYLDDGSDAGTAWREVEFADDSWRSGPSPLGYGDGDEATVVSFVD